jgi:hypothetical protein
LDRALFADWHADAVRNFLGDGFAGPIANGVVASPSFWNHVANSLAYILDSLLANPFAGSVANGSSSALGNHFASLVANGTLTALRNHLAGGVANGPATWLANIAANRVRNRLAVAFGNHLAGGVANGSLTALGNHLADGVRNRLGYTASLVTHAVDFLGLAGWNPNLLANRSRWALYAFNTACTWAIYASATRLIPYPSTRLADSSSNYRTGNLFGDSFPVTTIDGDRLGVVHWRHYRANNFPCALFLNRNHYGVVDHLFVSFANWLHHGVVDDSLAGLIHGLTNRIVDYLFVGFTNGNHHGVVDYLLMGFNYWSHYRVLNFLGVGVVHRSANVVRYLVGLCFPDWLHDGVFTSPSLINRLANCLIDRSHAGFSLHPSHIDYLVFGNRLILGAHSLYFLLLIYRTANRPHYGMRCGSFPATSTACVLVAYRSVVCSVCSTGKCSQQGYQNRHDKQPSHLPFSLENLACVTGDSGGRQFALVLSKHPRGVPTFQPSQTSFLCQIESDLPPEVFRSGRSFWLQGLGNSPRMCS